MEKQANTVYKDSFFSERYRKTIHAATQVSRIVKETLPEVGSVVDFGCGVGAWLKAFQDQGVETVFGVDGPWVNPAHLVVSTDQFLTADLSQPRQVNLVQNYDLSVCLEVAEHLPDSEAENLINLLTSTSPAVLFSAAVPHQGGSGHVNEQWPTYWIELFEKKGYFVVDNIRSKIWNDENIQYWYKQNIFLFLNRKKYDEASFKGRSSELPHCVIHPQLYKKRMKTPGLKGATKIFVKSLRKQFRRFRT